MPELPCGQNLSVNIKSTWGDKYYVGLNGIELFADTGEPISISKVSNKLDAYSTVINQTLYSLLDLL